MWALYRVSSERIGQSYVGILKIPYNTTEETVHQKIRYNGYPNTKKITRQPDSKITILDLSDDYNYMLYRRKKEKAIDVENNKKTLKIVKKKLTITFNQF